MISVISLADALAPAPMLTHSKLEALCDKLITYPAKWTINDGKIDVEGTFNFHKFVDNGKLIAPFGKITAGWLNVSAIRSLINFPDTFTGDLIIGGNHLESLEGCPSTVNSLSLYAPWLTSLKHGPQSAKMYSVGSCTALQTTDGLAGAAFESLQLSCSIQAITEHPQRCVRMKYPICAGFPTLFLTDGLEQMEPSDGDAILNSVYLDKLKRIVTEVLSISGNKRRYLAAQTLLIDADLEWLL